MPCAIIPTGFGIVPAGVRAKNHPGKGANPLPFSVLLCFEGQSSVYTVFPKCQRQSLFGRWMTARQSLSRVCGKSF